MVRFIMAIGASLAALWAAPQAASAQGVLYDCTVLQTSGPGGWVSSRMAFVVGPDGAAQVVDSLSLQYLNGAVPARVRNRAGELRFNWSINNAQDVTSNRIPTMSYFAWLDTASGGVRVRVKPAGIPQSMRGQGTCTTRQNLTVRELNRLLRG